MRALLLIAIAGCAIAASPITTSHPASAQAPGGRLAGAPPALRPGVVVYDGLPAVAPTAPPAHHHHPQ